MTYFMAGFGVLLLVVVALLAYSGRRAGGDIVLPGELADAGDVGETGTQTPMNTIEITPETVRPAISTLSRPVSYSRTQVVETFWSGGSGQSVSLIWVSGGQTRLDTQLPDGSVRHMLLSGGLTGVWYDDESEWTLLRSRQLTADLAGRMLTYETVRDLPADQIAAADYREWNGVSCIYVETVPDEAGYADRYWVSVDSGLLSAAERHCRNTLIYRFAAGQPESAAPEASLFRLPDGSALEDAAA